MMDKPKGSGRPKQGGQRPGSKRPPAAAPGARPQRGARPERAGAAAAPVARGKSAGRARMVGGVSERDLEALEREGMLSNAGRRLRMGTGPAPDGDARPARAGKGPELARGPRPKAGAPAVGGRPQLRTRRMDAAEQAVAERLHKVMAQAGVASRRHSEELIQAGRVTVNGTVVTELGSKVIPGKDLIEVDGRTLGKPESLAYILLNKPKGYVTTLYDPQGRPKVLDLLGEEIAQRVYPVGRLDYDTEGLLLLTNDGELANALMHPARQVTKTYIAKVRGVPGPAKVKALEAGIELEDGVTAPAEVRLLKVQGPNAATLSVRIHEGRNRQVRRMFEAVGHEVIHLTRTTLGPLTLRELQVGQWRNLSDRDIADLRTAAGLRVMAPAAEAGRPGAAPRTGRGMSAAAGKPGAAPRRGAGRQGGSGAPRGEGAAFTAGARRPVRAKGPSPEARGEGAAFTAAARRPVRAKGPSPEARGERAAFTAGARRPVRAKGPSPDGPVARLGAPSPVATGARPARPKGPSGQGAGPRPARPAGGGRPAAHKNRRPK